MTPRGILNNNPFDIEKSNIKWEGLVEGTDPKFCTFSSPMYGLRCGFIDLKVKLNQRIDTIRKIITKFAPPSENDTEAYIAAVSARTGIDPDKELFHSDIPAIGKAIIFQEIGEFPYDDATVNQALASAGVPNKPITN